MREHATVDTDLTTAGPAERRGSPGTSHGPGDARPRVSVRGVRVLVGPNLWRDARAAVCQVTADVAPTPELAARLAELRDALPAPDAVGDVGLGPGSAWAVAVGALAVGLQRRVGIDVSWWRALAGAAATTHLVAVEYEEESTGRAALLAAADLVEALADGETPDVNAAIDDLRRRRTREHLGPTASALVAEARRRGISVRRVPGDPVVQLGLGSRQRRIDATLTDRTSVLATDITSDEARAKRLLARLGVPVPRGGVATTADEAVEIADDVGYPVLVKPLDASDGRGVSSRLDSPEEVREAFARARAEHPRVVVERFAAGRDHRVLVVAGRVVAVAERVPAHVVGDGARTVAQLAEEANRDPRRDRDDPSAPLAPILLDDVTEAYLARAGRALDTVPAAGETVFLRATANSSTGGIAVDRTDEIHPDNAALCAFAADALGLDVAGIDVLTPDVSVPFRANGAVVVEVSASPGIRMHTDPQRGAPRDVPGAVLDALFPPGAESRVPILAITGTNGKTTTTRLLAHVFRGAGARVGFATTDGVYHEDRTLLEGDLTGPMGADMVLSHPRVDVAVLETARGGILRSGLGYDGCDAALVLNVTADHLGIDGIDTVGQLARAKAVVVRALRPGGRAVLNADDPLAYAMRDDTGEEVVLFTAGPAAESPAVRAHVDAGGRAASVEPGGAGGGTLTLHRGGERTPLLAVAEIPLTAGGAARFQVANAAAASVAAWALGVPLETIRAALASFVPSTRMTPGRMNVVPVGDATVVIDYAHNEAAIAALLDYARRTAATRRVGVIGMPGDRNDEALRAVGVLAVGLDLVIFKEHPRYRRGRAAGETAGAMLAGYVDAGGDPACAVVTADEDSAVAELRARLRAGDLALFLADDAARVLAALGGER